MKTTASFITVILGFLVHHSPTKCLVITKLDSRTMANYYHHLQKWAQLNDYVANPIYERDLFEFCHELRQSKVFHRTKFEKPIQLTHSTIRYNLSTKALRTEKNQVRMQILRFRVRQFAAQVSIIPSFQCLDLNGILRWFITPSFIPDSAFLFSLESLFHYQYSRERDGKREIPVQLTAIVDEPATIIDRNSRSALSQSIKATNFDESDSLCTLNKILQFRLCVIVGDAKRGFERIRPMGNAVTSQSYLHRLFNTYYQPANSSDSCRPVKALVEIEPNRFSLVTRKMLYCSVHIPEVGRTRPFYLNLNMLDTSTVIHFIDYGWTSWLDILKVPLLQHIEKYTEALRNFDIK